MDQAAGLTLLGRWPGWTSKGLAMGAGEVFDVVVGGGGLRRRRAAGRGVPVGVDLPGVAANLADHAGMDIDCGYRAPTRTSPSSIWLRSSTARPLRVTRRRT
jgi:hypothetical protein